MSNKSNKGAEQAPCDEKEVALQKHLESDAEEFPDVFHLVGNTYKCEGQTFLVMTDEEADEEQLKSEKNTLYCESWFMNMPDTAKKYFNERAYLDEVVRDSDRANLLSCNGLEHCEYVDGTWYYIYELD